MKFYYVRCTDHRACWYKHEHPALLWSGFDFMWKKLRHCIDSNNTFFIFLKQLIPVIFVSLICVCMCIYVWMCMYMCIYIHIHTERESTFMITVNAADGFVSCIVFVRWGCLMSRYMERNPMYWPPSLLPRALLRLPSSLPPCFPL